MKKLLCLVLTVITIALFSACEKVDTSNVQPAGNESASTTALPQEEQNKIISEISSFSYNDDGTATVHVSVKNNTPFAKKLKTIVIEYIRDSKGVVLVENGVFNINDETFSVPGSTQTMECVFEKDQIAAKSNNINEVTSKITVQMDSCVYGADEAKSSDKQEITYSLTQAVFTNTNSLDAKLSFKNNFKKAKKLVSVKIEIFDNNGNKVNKEPVEKKLDISLKPDESVIQSFSVLASNITDAFSDSTHSFDTLTAKCEITVE